MALVPLTLSVFLSTAEDPQPTAYDEEDATDVMVPVLAPCSDDEDVIEYSFVNENELYSEFFAHQDDVREDYDLPIVLLVHHTGRPLYTLVLDVMIDSDRPTQQVAMYSNWLNRRNRTPYHGAWRASITGELHMTLRWFATAANRHDIHLVGLTLIPSEKHTGLYASDCGKIVALRFLNDTSAPSPAAAVEWCIVVQRDT